MDSLISLIGIILLLVVFAGAGAVASEAMSDPEFQKLMEEAAAGH